MANVISNMGIIPTVTITGSNGSSATFTDLTNLIVAQAQTSSATSQYSTFRKNGSATSYSVTSGKTLTIRALVVGSTSAANDLFNLGYCDNDVGFNSSTAPINPVYVNGLSTSVVLVQNATIGGDNVRILQFSVPATKYPFVINGAANNVSIAFIYGYEN